jgi:hypothetical protein
MLPDLRQREGPLTAQAQTDDAEIGNIQCKQAWAECARPQRGNYLVTNYQWGTVSADKYDDGFNIRRIFLNFNTELIPSNAVITGATLHVYAGAYLTGATRLQVFASTAETPPTHADFPRIVEPALGTGQPDRNAWLSIPLNEDGLQKIAKEGRTKFVLAHALDLGGVPPQEPNNVLVALSESGGYAPYLVVDYHTP